jgi:PAS domain-containing protein
MSDEKNNSARTSVEKALWKDKTRLENAIKFLSDAFVLYDAGGKLVLYNQKHLDFYPELTDIYRSGASREEILRHHAALIRKNDPTFDEERYLERRLIAINEPRPDSERKLPDGRWIAVCERLVPGGGMVSIRTDITERKRIEQALQNSEEQLRAIFNHVPAAFFLKDAEGRYKFINSRYADWFGFDPDTIEGKSVHEM